MVCDYVIKINLWKEWQKLMGYVTVQDFTTKNPIQLMGYEAGVCWDAAVHEEEKNYKRGLSCVTSQHGRTWEFPQVYLTLEGYSARVIRELYTHIGGSPSRLQASSRYIDYENGFYFVTPPEILKNDHARGIYQNTMREIMEGLKQLDEIGTPREDAAMLLPLGMETKVVLRTNFRNLVDMAHQRMCSRAYWEFRNLFNDIAKALSNYSDEWNKLVNMCFEPKCEYIGYCPEEHGCGRKEKKGE
jgi:thymidylate synthase (FAD)